MWYFKSLKKNPVKYLFQGYIVIFKITSNYESNTLMSFHVIIPGLTPVNFLAYFLVFFIHTCSRAYSHILFLHNGAHFVMS